MCIRDRDWTPYVSGLSYAANQHLVVYEKVTDKVGNTEYFSTDGIIVDNTSPVPVVTITPVSYTHLRLRRRGKDAGNRICHRWKIQDTEPDWSGWNLSLIHI